MVKTTKNYIYYQELRGMPTPRVSPDMRAETTKGAEQGTKTMTKIQWEQVTGEFERFPKLELKEVDDTFTGTFLDDGDFVSKATLENAGAKYARDSFLFRLEDEDGNKHEFWQGAKSFSTLNQLKSIGGANGELTGKKVKITRVSTDMKETNWEIEVVE